MQRFALPRPCTSCFGTYVPHYSRTQPSLISSISAGRPGLRLSRPGLWYAVCPDRRVLLVIVRDPTGKQHDDFFFTTDLEASAPAVVEHYAGRWSIEDTFRSGKQSLGGEDPQTWKGQGPERAAALSLWLYSAVWCWYITTHGTTITWPALPWYAAKRTPSFADALAALRRALWSRRIFSRCARNPLPQKMAASFSMFSPVPHRSAVRPLPSQTARLKKLRNTTY
jgi:hypothetical protein